MLDEISNLRKGQIPIDTKNGAKIQALLNEWFERTPKNIIGIRQDRIKEFSESLNVLATKLIVEVDAKTCKVKTYARGDYVKTLALVKFGSTWFDGFKDFDAKVAAALGLVIADNDAL